MLNMLTGLTAAKYASPTLAPIPDFDLDCTVLTGTNTGVYLTLVNDEYAKDLYCYNDSGTKFPFVWMDGASPNWWERNKWKATVSTGSDTTLKVRGKGIDSFNAGTGSLFQDNCLVTFTLSSARHLEELIFDNFDQLTDVNVTATDLVSLTTFKAIGGDALDNVTTGDLPFVTAFKITKGETINIGDCPSLVNMHKAYDSTTAKYVTMGELPAVNDLSYCFSYSVDIQTFSAENLCDNASDGTVNAKYMFNGCTDLTSPPAPSDFNTSAINDADSMFNDCQSLTGILDYDYSNATNLSYLYSMCDALVSSPATLDFSSATTMYHSFTSCDNLLSPTAVLCGNVSNFEDTWANCTSFTTFPVINVDSATVLKGTWRNCSSMSTFSGSNYQTITTFDSTWKDSGIVNFPLINMVNGTSFDNTWQNCINLVDASEINLIAAITMNESFKGCSSLTTIDYALVSSTNCTSLMSTFEDCVALKTVPLLHTASVTDMEKTFKGCIELRTIGLMLLGAVTNLEETFMDCKSVTTFPAFNLTGVVTADRSFAGCWSLKDQANLTMSNLTTSDGLFQECRSLIHMSVLNAPLLDNLKNMFKGSASLRTIDVPLIPSCTKLEGTFSYCYGLRTVPSWASSGSISDWTRTFSGAGLLAIPTDLSGIAILDYTFAYCNGVPTIPALTTTATSADYMFKGCELVESTGTFTANSITDIVGLYEDCNSMKTGGDIYLDGVTDMGSMFKGCYALTEAPKFKSLSSCTTMQDTFRWSGIEIIRELDLTNSPNLYLIQDPTLVNPNHGTLVAAASSSTYVTNSNPRVQADIIYTHTLTLKTDNLSGGTRRVHYSFGCVDGFNGHLKYSIDGGSWNYIHGNSDTVVFDINVGNGVHDIEIYSKGVDAIAGKTTTNCVAELELHSINGLNSGSSLSTDNSVLTKAKVAGVFDSFQWGFYDAAALMEIDDSGLHARDTFNLYRNCNFNGLDNGAAGSSVITFSPWTRVASRYLQGCQSFVGPVSVPQGSNIEDANYFYYRSGVVHSGELCISGNCWDMYYRCNNLLTCHFDQIHRPNYGGSMFELCPLVTHVSRVSGEDTTGLWDWFTDTPSLVSPTPAEQAIVEGGGYFGGID